MSFPFSFGIKDFRALFKDARIFYKNVSKIKTLEYVTNLEPLCFRVIELFWAVLRAARCVKEFLVVWRVE